MTFVADDSPQAQPGVRAKPPQHPEEYTRGVYACGMRRDHVIRVHRANWPPRTGGNPQSDPRHYVAGLCERCGANLIVYDPPDRQVTVLLYGSADEAHGRVEDEVGQVIEEAAVPKEIGRAHV